MTQVSRLKLKTEIEERIYELFNKTLAGIKSKNEIDSFLDDFLSPTEKTVFAKRLAVAVLLAKGNDYAQIRTILRVTPVTISKMSLRMKSGNGAVKKEANRIVVSDDNRALLEELTSIFNVPTKGLPLVEFRNKSSKKLRNIQRFKKEL